MIKQMKKKQNKEVCSDGNNNAVAEAHAITLPAKRGRHMLITAVVPQQCSECARGRSRLQTKVYIDALMLKGHICADTWQYMYSLRFCPRQLYPHCLCTSEGGHPIMAHSTTVNIKVGEVYCPPASTSDGSLHTLGHTAGNVIVNGMVVKW